MLRAAALLSVTLSVSLLQACGGGGSDTTSPPVVTPPPRVLTSIEVTPPTSTVQPGASTTLTATGRDGSGSAMAATFTWSSSNSAVATVSQSGQVTGVTDGVASITATSGSVSGSAAVTVRSNVSAVSMSAATLAMTVGGATVQLTATPRNANGTALEGRPITWASTAPQIASVTQAGVVTAVGAGQAGITATSEGAVGTTTVTVAPQNPCAVIRTIPFGQTADGVMSNSDCKLGDNTPIQRYRFTLAQRTKVEIVMSSATVDPYLFLFDDKGTVLEEDDDGGTGLNARIMRTLAAGTYEVGANVFAGNSFGAFQLAVRQAPAACISGPAVAIPFNTTGALSGSASCRLNDDSYENRYELTVPVRTVYRMTMSSTAVDPYLVVIDANERLVMRDDDSGGDLNASLEVQLEPGRYTVLAQGYPGETGSYRLTVAAAVDPCAVNRTIAVGGVSNATLASTDCRQENGGGDARYLHRYLLQVATTSTVQIDLTSTAFDANLIVQNAATAAVVAENDDAVPGQTTDSRLLLTLTPGNYVINVTSYEFGEIGPYRLSVTSGQPTNITVGVNPTTMSLTPGQTVSAVGSITGTPNTGITWSSDAPNIASVTSNGTSSATVRGIVPGTARITARSVADPSKSATLTVTVSAAAGAVNLDIAGMYLAQSVQQLDGRVPLVANRDAVARVFVRTSGAAGATVAVRLRVYQGATLLNTLTANATTATTINEGCCAANIIVPASAIRAGVSVLADVDPTNTVSEANESDNQFPLSGTAQALNVVTVPPFSLRIVPVRQARSGLQGQYASSILHPFRSMWPIGTLTVTTRAPLVVDYTLGPEDYEEWGNLARDLEVVRRTEGGASYYYGLVRSTSSAGVLGIANGIPSRAAVGVDEASAFGAVEARLTLAHELGHSLGLRHAPCGDAAGPDPNYPFADGRIGAFGVDLFEGNLFPPTFSDIMSYCSPEQWVSAYNYRKVMDYRAANPTGSGLRAGPVMMVSGAIRNGSVRLDPAFSIATGALVEKSSGRYQVEGLDAAGKPVFTWRFDAFTVEDGGRNAGEAFVVAVPVSEAQQMQVRQIVVRDAAGRTTAVRRGAIVDGAADPVFSVRRSGAAATMAWSPASVPAVMVRERATGTVLALSRSGEIDLSQFGALDRLEVLASNGTRSTTLRYDARTGSMRQ
jgi:uncharacterized protein YjdB